MGISSQSHSGQSPLPYQRSRIAPAAINLGDHALALARAMRRRAARQPDARRSSGSAVSSGPLETPAYLKTSGASARVRLPSEVCRSFAVWSSALSVSVAVAAGMSPGGVSTSAPRPFSNVPYRPATSSARTRVAAPPRGPSAPTRPRRRGRGCPRAARARRRRGSPCAPRRAGWACASRRATR